MWMFLGNCGCRIGRCGCGNEIMVFILGGCKIVLWLVGIGKFCVR